MRIFLRTIVGRFVRTPFGRRIWKSLKNPIDKLASQTWILFGLVFIIVALAFIPFINLLKNKSSDVAVEVVGLLLDIALFGVVFSVYDSWRLRKQKIERLREELTDLLDGTDETSILRKAGNIKRLIAMSAELPHLDFVQLRGADLSRVNLTAVSLPQADLADTMLVDTDLSFAILANAKFSRALLHGTKFGHAELMNADFSNAEVRNVDFCGTDLSNVLGLTDLMISRSLTDKDTKLPDYLLPRLLKSDDSDDFGNNSH